MAGIMLFVVGSIYGVYHPVCPGGELVKDYPAAGMPIFTPHCLRDGVLYDAERDYVYPAGGIVSTVLECVGGALFLWGLVLPIVRWFRGRAARSQAQAEASVQAVQQQALASRVAQARGRVAAAYYCGRDDGFFIPGYPQFFPRGDWLHFLFG